MICEICGKSIKKANRIIIEGTILNVCDDCKKLGTPLKDASIKDLPFLPEEIIQKRLKKRSYSKIKELDMNEVLVEHYGMRVKQAREKKQMTLEELAKRVLEKKSLISKIERQEARPSDKLIKKLERVLNIKLKEKVAFINPTPHTDTQTLTLGDYIKHKQKK